MRAERILGTVIYWFKVNEETIGKETLCSVSTIKTTGSRHKFFTFVDLSRETFAVWLAVCTTVTKSLKVYSFLLIEQVLPKHN